MSGLNQQVASLTDEQVIKVIRYLTTEMQEEFKKQEEEIDFGCLDDNNEIIENNCVALLQEAFPEYSDSLNGLLPVRNDEMRDQNRAKVARNLIIFMAEEKKYATKVTIALEKSPQINHEPITWILVAATVVFLLSLEGEVKGEKNTENGKEKTKWSWKITRKATPVSIIKKLLGVGANETNEQKTDD
ncbi:MAG: hypothetical protein FD167_2110 [bacterium]|nr:MAG: hypothetical protein FD167_2110 [bacterium]